MSAPFCYLFEPEYAKIQRIKGYELFRSEFGIFPLATQPDTSISLPKSPFGGFLVNNVSKEDLFHWLDQITLRLKGATNRLFVKQPIEIYPTVKTDWLLEYGFERDSHEISHYIDLKNTSVTKLHVMQQRKLKASTFQTELMDESNLSDIHKFISQCRIQQGLTINITYEDLKQQVDAFPDKYLLFAAKEQNELAAACIVTLPTDQVAYYYLPATNPAYKSKSPMVPLMVFIYEYLLGLGIQFMDLGISSIEGVPQKSLITFKERMGGIKTERVNLTYNLEP